MHLKNQNIKEVLFRSEGFISDCSVPFRDKRNKLIFADISPYLRTLLVTDGTVTNSLEAFFWEPIDIEIVDQGISVAEHDVPLLQVVHGEKIMTRGVNLRGKKTRNIYATASSVVRTKYIPESFKKALMAGEKGIGVLIQDCGLESYREILKFGSEHFQNNGHKYITDMPGNADIIYRTYRIFLSGKPVILITERFLLELYS